jgi:hypothetical protein
MVNVVLMLVVLGVLMLAAVVDVAALVGWARRLVR